jgi:hypothetical protein
MCAEGKRETSDPTAREDQGAMAARLEDVLKVPLDADYDCVSIWCQCCVVVANCEEEMGIFEPSCRYSESCVACAAYTE